MEKVLIFKTGVESKQEVERVFEIFNGMHSIKQWNVDLDDSDRILRIACVDISPEFIEDLFEFEGIYCENMAYNL